MTGQAVFNEVFLDGAVCDAADLVGGEGNGWAVTQTTLHFERTGIGAGGSHAGFPDPGPKGGMLGRRAGDAALDEPPNAKLTVGYPDVVELAQKHGRSSDPLVRQDLARLYAYTETGRWNGLRGKAEAQRGGGQAVASIGKLGQTRIVKLAARLGIDIVGALDLPVEGLAGGSFEHDAVRYAKEALALDRFRETCYVRLMRLHMSRGNRAEAMRAYEQCRHVLARDLGVTPSPQTEAVYREVFGS
jgi:alkylation response protein AidB-like acyl-CoA dehydrogenase